MVVTTNIILPYFVLSLVADGTYAVSYYFQTMISIDRFPYSMSASVISGNK